MNETEFQHLKEVKKKHRDELQLLPNVIGFGIGYKITNGEYTDKPCLRVYVTKKVTKKYLKKAQRVPLSIDNIATDVIELGGIPQAAGHEFTLERPARGGAEVSGTGGIGTLASLFLDPTDSTEVLLSNNHVIANVDDVDRNIANVGDPVDQPWGGDTIATLKRWIKFEIQPTKNQVDAAMAEIVTPGEVSSNIHEIGVPTGYRTLTVDDVGITVQKSGRTTGYTTGVVFDVASDVTMSYSSGSLYDFEDQLLIQVVGDDFTGGGDSGSLVLDMNGKATGLFYGHIPGHWSWCSHINVVLSQLNIMGISKSWPCVTLFIGGVDVTRY